jgi:hypothetical protein
LDLKIAGNRCELLQWHPANMRVPQSGQVPLKFPELDVIGR